MKASPHQSFVNLIPTTDSSIHYEFQSNQDIATILIDEKSELPSGSRAAGHLLFLEGT
jgi:hypothetical protein